MICLLAGIALNQKLIKICTVANTYHLCVQQRYKINWISMQL